MAELLLVHRTCHISELERWRYTLEALHSNIKIEEPGTWAGEKCSLGERLQADGPHLIWVSNALWVCVTSAGFQSPGCIHNLELIPSCFFLLLFFFLKNLFFFTYI